MELSAAGAGLGGNTIFHITAPDGNGVPGLNFLMRRSAYAARQATVAAPATCVLSVEFDGTKTTTAEQIRPRINGAVPALSQTAVPGPTETGVFANDPIYLFRRGGATLPFSGRLYEAVVWGGGATAPEIADIERSLLLP